MLINIIIMYIILYIEFMEHYNKKYLEKLREQKLDKIFTMNKLSHIEPKDLLKKKIPNIFINLMIKNKDEEKINKMCLMRTAEYKKIINDETIKSVEPK
jgi:hypothetical protein